MSKRKTVIIGGGQAGLAMGHALTLRGLRADDDFVILDASSRTGATWSDRWDSLRLFTPAQYSALPGMAFPGPQDAYPSKDEVAAYLDAYATAFDLPVQHRTRVTKLTQNAGDKGFVLDTSAGIVRAETVVVATGPFQKPAVPNLAAGLAHDVVQLHSAAYQNPAQIPPGKVVVVGAANSGAQIAMELAATHEVTLAVGTRLPTLPQQLAGQDIFTWLTRAQIMNVSVATPLGRRLSRRDVLVGTRFRHLRAAGVDIRGRVIAAAHDGLTFAGEHQVHPAAVVWATGYRPDYSWLPPSALAANGRPLHDRGLTPVPGLSVIGLPWMHTRGSALLGWVGQDAAWLANQLQKSVRA